MHIVECPALMPGIFFSASAKQPGGPEQDHRELLRKNDEVQDNCERRECQRGLSHG
jgi:hypothetical protein